MPDPEIDETGPEPTQILIDWNKPQIIYTETAGQIEIVERCMRSPRNIGGFFCCKEKGHPEVDHVCPRYNSGTSIRWID